MDLAGLERAVNRAFQTNRTDPLLAVAADSGLSSELAKAAMSLGSREPSEEHRRTLRGSAEEWL